jgi:hypothetical protein
VTRLVLHVGLPKTGTTAFQEFISANRDRMPEHGLAYCHMLRGPNHAQLAVAFSHRINKISEALGVMNDADQARLRQRLARRMSGIAGDSPSWIASSEHLVTMVRRPADIAALAGFLRGIYDDVLVIFVLRRSDYWLPSAYAEQVVSGGRAPLDARFVGRRGYLMRHRRLMRRWGRAFGRDNVRAVPFLEQDKQRPRALPIRILRVAGLPPAAVRTWPVPAADANPSLGAEATELLRRLSPHLRTSALRPTTSRQRVADYVAIHWPGPPLRLTAEAAEELRRLRLVRTRVGRSRFATGPGWLKWKRQPDAPVEPPPAIAAELVQSALDGLHREGLLESGIDGAAAETARRWLIRVTRR